MPWIVAVCACLVGGCFFDADYRTGTVRCDKGACPAGQTCNADKVCVGPREDAAVADTRPIDAPPAALTCNQAGPFPATGGMASGSTVSRTNTVSAMCGGSVMTGADAVYKIATGAGANLTLTITGPLNAYVIAPCALTPATPLCLGNVAAAMNSPVTVTTTFAGDHFIIVDSTIATTTGAYTLTVSL